MSVLFITTTKIVIFLYFLLDFSDLLFMRRWYSACTSFYALVAYHGARGDEGLVQSVAETGDDFFQVFAFLLGKQWGFEGYNVHPFCGITEGATIITGWKPLINHEITLL